MFLVLIPIPYSRLGSNRVFPRIKPTIGAVLCALVMLKAHALPSFTEVQQEWRTSDVQLLDRHGVPIQRVRVDPKQRKLDWVSLPEISPALRQALIISEDKRFYQHSGVDWSAAAASSWGNLWNNRTRGASTLTMQLVGLLNDNLKNQNGKRSFSQKLGQTLSARWLERSWTKAQILEAYLNLVSFRGEIVGLPALTATLFDKTPAGLNNRESAITVALLRAPNAPAAKVSERACRILADLKRPEDCAIIKAVTTMALARHTSAYLPGEQIAPHFARKLLTQYPSVAGSRIRTTLDANLQRYAIQLLHRQLAELRFKNVEDGALIVLDNASGDILAWVGSNGDASSAGEVDGVTALRQAGSTLKPFLYQLAIEGNWLTAASILNDAPLDLNTSGGSYNPQNYARDFKGPVSARTALASSLNTPAVRTLELVTPNRLRERLFNLGLSSLSEAGDYYGFSLALGAADIRLVELANAYRTLANLGMASAPRWMDNQPKAASQRLLDAGSSFIIGDILSDRTARARTFGLESVLATPFWSAVKTGTSKDMRDNWTMGYSQRYTVGVWVGNASGAPMWDVSGMHGAAPIWLGLMQYLHRSQGSKAPPPPTGIEQRTIHFEKNLEPDRREWFVNGTAQDQIYLANHNSNTKPDTILTPRDGAIYAIDPDIPLPNQRIVFKATGNTSNQWWLDGKPYGKAVNRPWFPWPGKHVLELRSPQKVVLDSARFEIRGAQVKDKAKPPKITN